MRTSNFMNQANNSDKTDNNFNSLSKRIQKKTESTVSVHSRRRTVRNILIGTGVITSAATIEKWTKPVINSLVLPAHAQTSTSMPSVPVINPVGNFTTDDSLTLNATQKDNEAIVNAPSVSDTILDFFVPNANAGISEQSPSSVSCGSNCNIDVHISYLAEGAQGISICITGDIAVFLTTGVDTDALTLINGGINLSSSPNLVFNGGRFNDTTGNWEINFQSDEIPVITAICAPGGPGALAQCSA